MHAQAAACSACNNKRIACTCIGVHGSNVEGVVEFGNYQCLCSNDDVIASDDVTVTKGKINLNLRWVGPKIQLRGSIPSPLLAHLWCALRHILLFLT